MHRVRTAVPRRYFQKSTYCAQYCARNTERYYTLSSNQHAFVMLCLMVNIEKDGFTIHTMSQSGQPTAMSQSGTPTATRCCLVDNKTEDPLIDHA